VAECTESTGAGVNNLSGLAGPEPCASVAFTVHSTRHPALRSLLSPLIPLALAAATAMPARAADLAPLRPQGPPFFTGDVAISVDSDGHASLAVTITVPYSELQWIRRDRGWASGAEFTVVLEARDGPGPGGGDVWERRLLIDDFGLTRSPNTSLVERRKIAVPPGRFDVRLGVRGADGGEASEARGSIEVPDYAKIPVGFSDLEIGVVDSAGTFTPIPTRRLGPNVAQLAARVSLFDRRQAAWPRDYVFRWRILDELTQELVRGEQRVQLSRSAEPVVVRPTESNLFLGSYVFEIEVVEGKAKWKVDRSFEVEESGPPRGKEYERMLEPLSLIADSREMAAMRVDDPAAQTRAWEDFWRRRDPTPDTPRNEAMLEFFRRVRYADQHFQGFGPGWRSDMGRVYIKHGPPDQVESRAASATIPQLEIWYYNQPYRRFVFADREGFGRFVLTNPGIE
jgi:GWxTD domain-containing protein